MKFVLMLMTLLITKQYIDFQIQTGDKSLQGFLQYLKNKFYDKNDTDTRQ